MTTRSLSPIEWAETTIRAEPAKIIAADISRGDNVKMNLEGESSVLHGLADRRPPRQSISPLCETKHTAI